MKNKAGRKRRDWVNPLTNKPVVGLTLMKGGRWRIIGTQIRFTESDPQKAVERYHRLTSPPGYAELEKKCDEFNRLYVQPKEEKEAAFWARVVKELTDRPKYAAMGAISSNSLWFGKRLHLPNSWVGRPMTGTCTHQKMLVRSKSGFCESQSEKRVRSRFYFGLS